MHGVQRCRHVESIFFIADRLHLVFTNAVTQQPVYRRERDTDKHKAQRDRFICHKSIAEVRMQQRRNSYRKTKRHKRDCAADTSGAKISRSCNDWLSCRGEFVRVCSMLFEFYLCDSDDSGEEAKNAKSRQGNWSIRFVKFSLPANLLILIGLTLIRFNYFKIRTHHDDFSMEFSTRPPNSGIFAFIKHHNYSVEQW